MIRSQASPRAAGPTHDAAEPPDIAGRAPEASVHVALFLPVLGDSGVRRVMLHLAGTFARRGLRVDLVVGAIEASAAEAPSAGVTLVRIAECPIWRGWLDAAAADPRGLGALLRALVLAGKPGGRMRYLPGLVSYLREARPDVLLTGGTVANLMALWARRRAHVALRIVAGEHNNLSHKILGRRNGRAGARRAVARLVGHVYPWADALVAVSDGVADDLAVTAGLPREAIATVYNPVVSSELLDRANAALDDPWFAPGAPPVVLGVGKLHPAKDFATLIGAFARLRRARPARLLILGEGGERAALEARVGELGLDDDVRLPGFAANPFAYMAQAGVFVLSSRWEGLGNVLIEALACGCPVVSTNCPSGPREILDDGACGTLVPVGDEAALAAAIEAALDAAPERETLRARAAEFSVEASAGRYLELILGGG